jgi:type I restriction enzyme R subunit
VSKAQWEKGNQRGGYIWHTTGSGKTLTSLIGSVDSKHSKDADKVIFSY